MLWQCGEEGRRLNDGMLHLVTLSAVGEGEEPPEREQGGIFRVNVPPGVQQPTENMSTMVRSISCQSRSRSDSMQRGYFDSQVARPRRDKRLGVVWELRADGFCTISSHFLLSVRCRMSITGKSLPRRRQRKEEQESNKGRRRKKRKKMFPNSVMSMMRPSFPIRRTSVRWVL